MTGRGSTCEGLPLQDREKAVGPSLKLGATAIQSLLPGPAGLGGTGREGGWDRGREGAGCGGGGGGAGGGGGGAGVGGGGGGGAGGREG